MSKIIHQVQGNDHFSFLNANSIQGCIFNFVKEQKGSFLQTKQLVSTFQLLAQIDEFEFKRIALIFEQRKKSFMFSFSTNIDKNAIPGGVLKLRKILENLNNKISYQNSHFVENGEGMIILKSIIDKESMQELKFVSFKEFIDNLLRNNNNQFVKAIQLIVDLKYEQSYNSNKKKQIFDVINIGKKFLEKKLKEKPTLQDKRYKFVSSHGLNTQVISQNEKIQNGQQIKKFQYNCKRIKQQFYKTSAEKPIVNKIKMINEKVDSKWKAPKSSNGILQKVSADFIVFYSVNENTSQDIAKLLKDQNRQGKEIINQMKQLRREQLCRQGYLVRKTLKIKQTCKLCRRIINPRCQCYMSLKSYQNQVQALSYIRNLNTQSIATYFFGGDYDSSHEGIKNTILYSTYYPKCLSGTKKQKLNLKDQEILLTILKILQGLQKLHTICLIHRDLKPDNILIDDKNMPKIIDFGSAWVYQNNESIQNNLNPELFTTKKYNLYYQDALFPQQQKMTKQEYQRHPLYDMHAIGKIIDELYKNSTLEGFFRINLNWLVDKCCSPNPNHRIDAQNAFYFCGLLLKFWNIRFVTN